MDNSSHKGRLAYMDLLKGIAIFFVVIGHFVLFNWKGALDTHAVYKWIYSFHMPLFFFIRGFFVEYTNRKQYRTAEVKKIKGLVVPYFFWCLILDCYIQGSFDISLILTMNAGRYWFLWMLFFFCSCYYFCDYIVGKMKDVKFLVPILLKVLLFMSFFCLGYFVYPCQLFYRGAQFGLFFLCGSFACQYDIIEKLKEKSLFSSIMFAVFIVSSLAYMNLQSVALNKLMKFVAGFSAIFSFSLYANSGVVNYENKFIKAIIYCGRNTIVIYLVHMPLLQVLSDGLIPLTYFTPFWTFVISLAASVVVVSFCVFLGEIFKNFTILDRLVFGRQWKTKTLNQ